jgi:pimeloyl-ACP methyl ester carboxylesterase
MAPSTRFLETPHGPVNIRIHHNEGPWAFLAIHGLGGSSFNWDVIAPMLDGPVMAMDLPGFGVSPPHPGDAIEAYVELVGGMIAELERPIVLIGNSLGGTVAEFVAARYEIDRLVLVAPATPLPPGRPPADLLVFQRLVRQTMPVTGARYTKRLAESKTPLGQVRELMSIVAADPASVSPDFVANSVALARHRRHLPWTYESYTHAARSLARRLVRKREFFEMIDTIEVPTMLLWGSQDRLVNPASLRNLSGRRPDWTAVTLEGVGHVPMLEVPATVSDLLSEWLATEPAILAG